LNRNVLQWLCSFALLSAAAAQDPDTIFKSKAELVLVPAVVTKDKEPVRGLTQKDFVLLHDGKPETIAVFEEIDATPARIEAVRLPAHTVQNYAPANAHQDVVILLLDFLNGSWSSSALIRTYIADMAKSLAEAHTPVTVLLLTRNGLVQVHSFTSAPENLAKAIDRWSSNAPLDREQGVEAMPRWSSAIAAMDTADTTVALQRFAIHSELLNAANLDKASMASDAVEQIAEAFRGIPGRKKLIWVSTGFLVGAVRNDRLSKSSDFVVDFRINDKRTRAWKSLSDANIAVYPIDSNSGQNPTWNDRFDVANSGSSKLPRLTSVDLGSDVSSMMDVAQKTGGQTCTDLPLPCLRRVEADANHYYVLGFYLHSDKKAGWHKLKVNLNQPNMSARAREGFVVGDSGNLRKGEQEGKKQSVKEAKKEADQQTEKAAVEKEVIITALASPLDYTSLPLRLTWSRLASQSNEGQIELVLNSPPGGISIDSESPGMNLDYLAFIRPVGKTEGRTIPASLVAKLNPQQQKSFEANGFLYRKQVSLAPGRYEVRVLLRDNIAGKIGTVSTLIDLTSNSSAN
jgi:VWFA-related protein